jgi:UDP-GlcNAc:undecaprenyl-phosphate GlcNAc-1-phosphate transferase
MGSTNSVYPAFIFYNILISLVLSLLFGWLAILFTRRFGPMDIPGSLPHKVHSAPTPLAGGLTLISTLLVGGLVFNFPMVRQLWNILVPALIIFAVGLWDDYKRLPAWIKFIGQLAAGVLLISLGTYVQIIPAHFLGLFPVHTNEIANWIITLFWVIGITNAFNFVDSMDGLVVGISGIALSFLVLVSLGSPQVQLLQLLTLMIGCCVGLFFYNLTPARFFIGDSGAQTVGFLLAAISIVYTPVQYPQASSWFLPIIILGIPIFDVTLVTFSRLRRRTPVYLAERNHTYHRLIDLGVAPTHAVATIHMAAIALGCIAFIALNLQPLFANLIFTCVCMIGLATIVFLDRRTP